MAASKNQRRTPEEVRADGLAALRDTLGVVDMARFFQHYELGRGDYTAERRKRNADLTVEEVLALAEQYRRDA